MPSTDSLASIFIKAVSINEVSLKTCQQKWTIKTMMIRMMSIAMTMTTINQQQPQHCHNSVRAGSSEAAYSLWPMASLRNESHGIMLQWLQHWQQHSTAVADHQGSTNFHWRGDILWCWHARFWHSIMQQRWHCMQKLHFVTSSDSKGDGLWHRWRGQGSYGAGASSCCHAMTAIENWR